MSAAAGAAAAGAATGPGGIFRRILRNAGVILGGKAATALINLGSTAIAIRALGIEGMGVLVLVHAFAQAASTLVKFQSWQAVVRYGVESLEPGRRAEFHALLRFTAGLDAAGALAACAICAGAAFLLGPAFGVPAGVAPLAALYATATVFMVMATPNGLLRLFDRFDLIARSDALGAAARLAGVALAALLGGGLPAFLGAWYASAAIGGLALVVAALAELRKRGLLPREESAPRRRRVRAAEAHPGIWGFVWSTNLMTTLSLGSGHVATLCVGSLLGPGQAALFVLARQVGEAALKPSRFLTPALYPELARLAAAGDQAGLRAVLRRGFAYSAAGAVAVLAALALLGGPLLRLVGGEAAAPAWGVMLLLACAASINFAGFALEPLLVSVRRHGKALRIRGVATLAHVPAALVGLRFFGLEGAGIAAVFSASLQFAWQAWAARRWLRARAGLMSRGTEVRHGG
ncbi:oligosaccharide flippase family protein [Craurococcus roseus]|uniref:Oligosaccharide flippase family protein n=1 Tax=Craurococcus roseus TaxID=77585 RepID=A0ABP3RC27_9PROT